MVEVVRLTLSISCFFRLDSSVRVDFLSSQPQESKNYLRNAQGMPPEAILQHPSYRGMKVAVTGASGFLGRHLLVELDRLQARVVALDRSHGVDLLEPQSLAAAIKNESFDVVFHLAASLNRGSTKQEAIENFAVNVNGTHNLLEALAGSPLCVIAGSADVYGSASAPFEEAQTPTPLTSYAASKLAAWDWARCFPGVKAVEARLFLLYGPGQDQRFFIPQLLCSRTATQPLAMTAGQQTRDFVWVEDAVEALLRLGQRPDLQGQSFNVCTGQETSLKQAVDLVSEFIGKALGAGMGKIPYREGEIFRIVGNPGLLEKTLGYRPSTSLRQGIKKLVGGYECK
jgi:nucleoside-diphosphate-sugar epimerase